MVFLVAAIRLVKLNATSLRFAKSTLISQLFMVLSTICSILLYSPEAVGLYGAGLAIVYSAGYFAGLRIDALMLSTPDMQERFFQLSCVVHRYQSIIVLLIAYLYFRDFVMTLLVTALSYLFSLTLLFIPYALQHQRNQLVARSRIQASFLLVCGQLIASFTFYGLFLGDLFGKLVHVLRLKKTTPAISLTQKEAWVLLKRFRKPLFYVNISSLGTALSMYAPILIITGSLGPEKGAVFFLVQRIAGFTEQLIGYTSYQLVISESMNAATHHSKEISRKQVGKVIFYTFVLLLMTLLGILFILQFPILREWDEVLALFILYIPLCLGMTWSIPLRTLLVMKGQWTTICRGEMGKGLAISVICLFAVVCFPMSYEQVICIGGALFTSCCLVYYIHRYIQLVGQPS